MQQNPLQQEPSAPPLQAIAGYENFSSAPILPTGMQLATAEAFAFERSLDIVAVSKDNARAALIELVRHDCCWAKGPAEKCEIVSTSAISSNHLKIETFIETRNVARVHRPYREEPHTTPAMGVAPLPWQFPIVTQPLWVNHTQRHEIPYTSVIERCHQCTGRGEVRCPECHGHRTTECHPCQGKGHHTIIIEDGKSKEERCHHCGGDGKVKCKKCNGHGEITCPTCQGARHLRWFYELTVIHDTLCVEEVLDKINDKDLSPSLISQALGTTLCQREIPALLPLSGVSDEIDSCSQRLLENTRQKIVSQAALQHHQRLTLRSIPVSECLAQFKGKEFRFWVYGEPDPSWGGNRRCECKDYPTKMCGCCLIC